MILIFLCALSGIIEEKSNLIPNARSEDSEKRASSSARIVEKNDAAEIDRLLAVLYQQKTKKYKGTFITKPGYFGWIKRQAQELRSTHFSVLELSGNPIALSFGFIHKGRFTFYLPSYDFEFEKYSPGRVLLYYLVKDACSKGLEYFDFGMGSEPYKFEWATEEVEGASFIGNSLLEQLILGVFLVQLEDSNAKRRLIFLVEALGTITFLVLVFHRADIRAALNLLLHVHPWPLLAYIGLYAILVPVYALRWLYINRLFSFKVPFRILLETSLISMFFNQLFIGGLGGGLYRSYILASRTQQFASSLANLVIERALSPLLDGWDGLCGWPCFSSIRAFRFFPAVRSYSG